MYIFFAAGFSYQILNAFAIPFPLDIILFPVTVIEWILRWQVHLLNKHVLFACSEKQGHVIMKTFPSKT